MAHRGQRLLSTIASLAFKLEYAHIATASENGRWDHPLYGYRGKMVISDLEEKIVRSLSEGGRPFLVAATAGTTVLGSFDPLDDVADVCDKYNLWYHVDVRIMQQEGLAVAGIARDVVVEMTPPRDDNAR